MPGKIAAVIVEPVAANMGVVPPARRISGGAARNDEARWGAADFRRGDYGISRAYGGAQTLFGIEPDLTTMGKIIGGGLPVAAYGGRAEIMEKVAPLGPVYQAGTLSGNPLAMRAGLATLPKLAAAGFYEDLNRKSARLAEGLRGALKESGVAGSVNAVGSLMTMFFTGDAVTDYSGAKKSDTKMYAAFFQEMLSRGVFIAPSQFEALFVSAAHSDADIERTIGRRGRV